jgi:hypothetical protein
LPTHNPPAQLEFAIGAQELSYLGKTVKAITASGASVIPVGTHPIQLPDFPHLLGSGYLTHSLYAKSWFYLGQGIATPGSNDRYLHTGRVSLGCLKVDPPAWTELYQFLIRCRGRDGTSGSLAVHR